jgi:hypothetical protein
MRSTALVWLSLALCGSAAAQTLERPRVLPGDSWIYRYTEEKAPSGWSQTRDELTVTRVTASSIYFTVRPAGSTLPPKELLSGSDWSRIRDVNGKETVVAQPLAFPLAPGKTWTLTYTEQNPDKAFSTETFDNKFNVVGYEDIEVPAGKYHALKIEAEGHWSGQLATSQSVVQQAQVHAGGTTMSTDVERTTPRDVSGRLYKAFWYAPEVKRWVKSIEEDYSTGGVRHVRRTMELESFKPGS